MVNSELKAQIEELRLERQQLMVMLNLHRPTCIVRTDSVKTPESEANPLLEQLSADAKWNRGHGFPDAQPSTTVAAITIQTELAINFKRSTWAPNWRLLETLPKDLRFKGVLRTAARAGSVHWKTGNAQFHLCITCCCCWHPLCLL